MSPGGHCRQDCGGWPHQLWNLKLSIRHLVSGVLTPPDDLWLSYCDRLSVNFFIVELAPYDFIHPIIDSQWNEFPVFVLLCIIVIILMAIVCHLSILNIVYNTSFL